MQGYTLVQWYTITSTVIMSMAQYIQPPHPTTGMSAIMSQKALACAYISGKALGPVI